MIAAVVKKERAGVNLQSCQTDANRDATFIVLPAIAGNLPSGACSSFGESPTEVLHESQDDRWRRPAFGHSASLGNSEEQSPQSLVGTRIRQYRLLELIGQGGMGFVYKARHERLGRIVAIKVVSNVSLQDRRTLLRFRREMRAVGPLNHPNIARAVDAEEIDEISFLAMELVHGPDFQNLVQRTGPLSVSDACELACQAASALGAVHQRGIVHRDVKPSNLLLDSDGQAKLTDFGLALLKKDTHAVPVASSVTAVGQIMGTPDYMAPEQAMDAHAVDSRVDIYGLGCTMFFLLTGAPPYRKKGDSSALKVILRHASDPVPDVRDFCPDVPTGLALAIKRLMGKSPGDRPLAAEAGAMLAPFRKMAGTEALWQRWSSDSSRLLNWNAAFS